MKRFLLILNLLLIPLELWIDLFLIDTMGQLKGGYYIVSFVFLAFFLLATVVSLTYVFNYILNRNLW